MVTHLKELQQYARVLPAVNQLEYSPLAPLGNLSVYCQQHNIILQGFGWRRPEVLEHPHVADASRRHGRPPVQVVVQWFLQQGHVPLYKSKSLERLLEHAEVFSDI